MKIKIRKELKAGIVELTILALLLERDMYGYEISNELHNRSYKHLEVKEGTLYPILYRLEEKEVIQSYWNAPEGRGKPRKYYQITLNGKEYFEDYKQEWMIVSKAVNNILNSEGDK